VHWTSPTPPQFTIALLVWTALSTGAELQAATVSAAMAPQNSFTNVFIVFVLLYCLFECYR
jgi:hypothetical protein